MLRNLCTSFGRDLRQLGVVAFVAAFCLVTVLAATSRAQSYDFNAGNDSGFTRYSPLAAFGAAGTFSFPSGGYRIQAPASPNPAAAGPGRAGSFVTANNYTTFTASIDLVDWDNSLNQAFGMLTRTRQLGLGTTDGYAFTYATSGTIDISRVTDEAATTIGSASVHLDPANDYRLVFQGDGNSLYGLVYSLADGITLADAFASDATYTSGVNGIFVFDNSSTKDKTADATFDNFSATNTVPEPTTLGVLLIGACLAGRRRR